MEKRRPSYDLDRIKATIGSVKTLSITITARRSAAMIGFDAEGIVEVIRLMDRRMFVKSMTTFADHHTWQDVYHVPAGDVALYVKFQKDVLTEFVVVSFKEK